VLVDDTPVEKAGAQVSPESTIRLRTSGSSFVGRGGDKLDGALEHFDLCVQGAIALDVGASTGGFTDCLLRRGASRVYAVDVGYNQLDFRLRTDERVVVREKTNAKELFPEQFNPKPSLAVIDVSFIGLRKILPAVVSCLENPCRIVALVKPQFELGPEYVEKGGVVRDEEHQLYAVSLVRDAALGLGLNVFGTTPSRLKGEKKGNQEYFIYLGS
jgi:23S rRNA (cytidine1920-2'-O)/16S rRNA (cytidine1409-2'-O)-methyltransferase